MRTASTDCGWFSMNQVRKAVQSIFSDRSFEEAGLKSGSTFIDNLDLSNSYKLIQLPEYLLLRRKTLFHACFPTLTSLLPLRLRSQRFYRLQIRLLHR